MTLHTPLPSSPARVNTRAALFAMLCVAALAVPELAFAQNFQEKTCGFLGQITGLLNIASIAVVTIGIIFAGYQIAFAHKRISDVAPILIGALLIGAAGQLANWIIGTREGSSDCGDISGGMAMIQQAVSYLA